MIYSVKSRVEMLGTFSAIQMFTEPKTKETIKNQGNLEEQSRIDNNSKLEKINFPSHENDICTENRR